jgi:hypothetical protein
VRSVTDDPWPQPTTIITGGTGRVEGRAIYEMGWPPLGPVIAANAVSAQATLGDVSYTGVDSNLLFLSVDATSTSIGRNSIAFEVRAWVIDIYMDPEGFPIENWYMVDLSTEEGVLNVLGHSAAAFADDSHVLNLDFGDIQAGSGIHSLSYRIKNMLAEYRAGLHLDGVTEVSDSGGVFSTDPVLSQDLAPGDTSSFFDVFLDSSTPGQFSGQYLLALSDQKDLSGSGGAQILTLNVTGNVVPEPCTFLFVAVGTAGLLARRGRRKLCEAVLQ